jgi:L-ribulose-5-phosphate 4-epimerase
VANATALEAVANMARQTFALNPNVEPIPSHLAEKHYLRKHGPNAYYGQGNR